MASRQQSIRVKIILLLVVPLAALLVLWVFAASGSFGDTRLLLKAKSLDAKLIKPTQALVLELGQERRLSLEALGVGHEADRSSLTVQRARTDVARMTFQRNVLDGGLRNGLPSELKQQMDGLSGRLGELEAMRGAVDVTGIARSTVLSEFNSLVDGAFAIYNAVSTGNAEIARQVRTLTALDRARELLSREDALVTGALAARKITPIERDTIAEFVGAQRFQYSETVPLLAVADRTRFQQFIDSPQFLRFKELEDSLVRGGKTDRPTVRSTSWDAAAPEIIAKFHDFELLALDSTAERAQSIAIGVLVRLALTGGLGLIAFIASIVIAVRIARKVISEVTTLAGVVGDFTTERMPELAERVRQGEVIEDDISPELEFTVSEVSRLSDAFDGARLAVVDGARSEVAARKGVSAVFVNLARRNQALLHRQLGLLDSMERRVEDPQELDELFRLDHLATCMRRHAEGLVILAGRSAGRTWRTPVPLIDVVRGAVGEVEDYTRVQVQPMSRVALTGTAVADTIHLLAELIENAAMFSPPQSPVQVTGHAGPNGFVIEVEDRGLGMSAELLAELNGRLTEAPEFDLLDSARLGMFVVARLAHRHDIQVSLLPSPYGGTTAVVLIPTTLIVSEDRVVPAPVAEAPNGSDGLKAIAMAPDPVEVVDAVDSTMPSFIVDASRRPADRTPVSRKPADRPAADVGTHKGMPRRKRQVGQVAQLHGEPNGAGTGTDDQNTHLGMPKRTRQASLAPQLRSDSWEPTEVEVNDSGSDRTPEALRARMAAMQSGWQRGRVAEPTTDPAAEQAADQSEVPVGPAVRPAKEEDSL
jgi:signal transduction histidine kinase